MKKLRLTELDNCQWAHFFHEITVFNSICVIPKSKFSSTVLLTSHHSMGSIRPT